MAACGGGSSSTPPPPIDNPPPPPPPPASLTPVADFSAASSAGLYTPVALDASASRSLDGSSLQYSWDFGGGKRGGGKTIAHLFTAAGNNSVTLTVIDGAGRTATQTKTISVTAPATAPVTANAQVQVKSIDGVVVDGVTIAVPGSTSTATTDAMGKASLAIPAGVQTTLKLSKSGYADQWLSITMPDTVGADAYLAATLRPRDAALTLASSAAGGTLTARDGAVITLPANALVNSSGAAITGAAQIAMTPVDVTQPNAGGFPGGFDGVKQDGTVTPIVSFGTTEYVLSANGESLQLAPGKTATIEVPLYATRRIDGTPLVAGDKTPLWSLDESSGTWIQEGEGTVVDSTASPSGLAMRATVSHFSWWNSDIGFEPYGPRPKCVYDTNITGIPGANNTFATATICNMIASIDRGLAGGTAKARDSLAINKTAAAALAPRIAGYSRTAVLPIGGGLTIPVPASVDIALDATALNGTWAGRIVVNGAVGLQEERVIPMRPLASTGNAPEAVTLPFDSTRALQTDQTAVFEFTGTALKYARVTVTRNTGSALIGSVRLLRGTTVLGSTTFGGAESPLIVSLPADATYTVEITGTANTPGGYRVQIEQLGAIQDEAISLPFDAGQKELNDFATYRGTFNVSAPTTVFIASTWLNARAAFSLLGPDGVAVYAAAATTSAVETATVPLTTAGNYTLKVNGVNGQATVFKATLDQTPWAPIAPSFDLPVTGEGPGAMLDMVFDRNGKAVVLYTRKFVSGTGSGAHTALGYLLQRWTGTAWEIVASEVSSDYACPGGLGLASLAFDSANNPVIAYNSGTVSGGGFTTVQKYAAGAWASIGPNGGMLPQSSSGSQSCLNAPVVQVANDDAPVVAYRANGAIYIQRFNGTVWADVATSGTPLSFAVNGNDTFDFRIAPDDRVWFVLAKGVFPFAEGTTVRRLSQGASPAWEAMGANGGLLPETTTQGLYWPHLRFDGTGSPVIGAGASVTVGPNTVSGGTVVYRFNGSTWSSGGGYLVPGSGGNSVAGSDLGFSLFNNEALVGWRTLAGSQIVQRNTASGWAAVGVGNGAVPQLSPHGITGDVSATGMRLGQSGTDLIMGIQVGRSAGGANRVLLLRKVGD